MDIIDYYILISSIKNNVQDYLDYYLDVQLSLSGLNKKFKRDIILYNDSCLKDIKSLRAKIKNENLITIEIRTNNNQLIKMDIERYKLIINF